jgi:hypothetical protein
MPLFLSVSLQKDLLFPSYTFTVFFYFSALPFEEFLLKSSVGLLA